MTTEVAADLTAVEEDPTEAVGETVPVADTAGVDLDPTAAVEEDPPMEASGEEWEVAEEEWEVAEEERQWFGVER